MQNSQKKYYFRNIIIFIFAALSIKDAYGSDRVRIAGSHAMYPIVTAVAERFSYETGEKAPIVEAIGTGGGIKVFCGGTGKRFSDMVVASRPMSKAEKQFCLKNGVTYIHEIQFGFDGIVLAHAVNKRNFSVHLQDLRMAFGNSDQLPLKWSDIDAKLPKRFIRIYGPSPASGTREALETLLSGSEKSFSIREDGPYINASDQENVIARKLVIEPGAIGVFSYGFYEKNHDRLRALRIDGIRPRYEAIVSGQYPLSRALYIYIKNSPDTVSKNFKLFIKVLLDPLTSGPQGYLREYGFIALPTEKHHAVREEALQFIEKFHNSN